MGMKMKLSNSRGFTLVETMIAVLIILMLAAIILPSVVTYTTRARARTCIANLKQIDGGMELYSIANGLSDGDPCSMADLVPAYIQRIPICPAGGAYSASVIGSPSCGASEHGSLEDALAEPPAWDAL